MRRRAGFTFIETLVVVLVVSVLFGASFVHFNNFSANQSLEKTRDVLTNKIKIARMDARASRKSPSGSDFSYISVLLDSNGLLTIEDNNGNDYSSGTVVFADVVVIDGLSVCELCFLKGDGVLVDSALEPNGVGDVATIILGSAVSVGETRVIIIDSSGGIEKR